MSYAKHYLINWYSVQTFRKLKKKKKKQQDLSFILPDLFFCLIFCFQLIVKNVATAKARSLLLPSNGFEISAPPSWKLIIRDPQNSRCKKQWIVLVDLFFYFFFTALLPYWADWPSRCYYMSFPRRLPAGKLVWNQELHL